MTLITHEQPETKPIIEETNENSQEFSIDYTLRPQQINDYIGQEKIKKQLRIFLDAAKKRNEPLEHILLYGPPGLGKTTLANIIAREMNVNIKTTSGPAIERVGDLGSILTNMQDGDVLFIDEIHRLNKSVEEVLYPAMEDHKLDLVVGKGPSAQALQIDLPKFTLIGATTRMGTLTGPLRDRFGVIHRLEFYNHDDIESIIKRSASILECDIHNDGAARLARASRQTPRIANRLLKRARDWADVHEHIIIDDFVAKNTLKMLDIDENGLEPTDREFLTLIIDKFDGGPVGVSTIANALSEEIQTIEDVYEPYLMQQGFLARSPRGRIVTEHGYTHLGK
ncbi:MAG: Holliday junction branch migration DNA helicase RuvB [Candidatus Moraniibacteriota bacterium]|nr:MAG: Holliday junction branch migration DNA helicase RuvB [Candidatus Moranbacteria bacterium]